MEIFCLCLPQGSVIFTNSGSLTHHCVLSSKVNWSSLGAFVNPFFCTLLSSKSGLNWDRELLGFQNKVLTELKLRNIEIFKTIIKSTESRLSVSRCFV